MEMVRSSFQSFWLWWLDNVQWPQTKSIYIGKRHFGSSQHQIDYRGLRPRYRNSIWCNYLILTLQIIFDKRFLVCKNFCFFFHQKINEKGETETVLPKTVEQAGLDKEPKVTQRNLPIDEFRYDFPKCFKPQRSDCIIFCSWFTMFIPSWQILFSGLWWAAWISVEEE